MTIPGIHGLKGLWVLTPKGCKCVNMHAHPYPPMGNMGAFHVHVCAMFDIPGISYGISTGWPTWSNPTNHGFAMVPSDLTEDVSMGLDPRGTIFGTPFWYPLLDPLGGPAWGTQVVMDLYQDPRSWTSGSIILTSCVMV